MPRSQGFVRAIGLRQELRDGAFVPTPTRVVRAGERPARPEDIMAVMYVRADGGSLRTFHGGLAHENGWYASHKRGRTQHWEGDAQLYLVKRLECEPDVEWMQTEHRRFEFLSDGEWRTYTCDIEVRYRDGSIEIVEVKRDDRALDDEEYAAVLAAVAEICRRSGMRFRVVVAEDIFVDRHHRDNVELFSSRRTAVVRPEHVRRLEAHALRHGPDSTYGELAAVLDPRSPVRGKAIVQSLTIRARVEIDLAGRLHDGTPVRIR